MLVVHGIWRRMSEYVHKPDIKRGIQNVKRQRGAAVRALVPRIPHSVSTLAPDDMGKHDL